MQYHKIVAVDQKDDIGIISIHKKRQECNCNDPLNYVPNNQYAPFSDFKYIRLNFHYMTDSTGTRNHTGEAAVEMAQNMLTSGNNKLRDNIKMNLPVDNQTPVIDPHYRYVMAEDENTPSGLGVYEHQDDDLYYFVNKGRFRNNYSKEVIKKYAISDDSILNVFVMPHHPDSLNSDYYKAGKTGIALGSSIKIAGIDQHRPTEAWKVTSLLNHEIGHVLSLRHSWYKNDGCDDTPSHPNCWSRKETGPCSEAVSNNMMDYNNRQQAITPCQIGYAHRALNKEGTTIRPLVVKDWCSFDYMKSMIVTDTLIIDRAFDVKGNIELLPGSYLRLSCRVHMPKGAQIIVHPNAHLVLNGCKIHNDCGEKWDGIKVLHFGDEMGKVDFYGNVRLENLNLEKADQVLE